MRISSIRLEGFRGVRGLLEIPCGSGFTVICGPNGTGKSTICDSLEFVLRGALSFREGTERGEYISDYLWWRGGISAARRSVSIAFASGGPEVLVLSRTPESGFDPQLATALIRPEVSPPDWESQLCLTSIIRDETITDLSTDRPERDRYEFALSTMGLTTSVAVERKIKDVISKFQGICDQAEVTYEAERRRVEAIVGEMSQARVATSRATADSAKSLREAYAEYGARPELTLTELAAVVAKRLAQLRQRQDVVERLIKQRRAIDEDRVSLAGPNYNSELAQARERVAALQTGFMSATSAYQGVHASLEQRQHESPALTSLALLREHGAKVGIRGGVCPLCGSQVTQSDFSQHLTEISNEVNHSNQQLADAVRAESRSATELESVRRQFEAANREYKRLLERGSELIARENFVSEQVANLGIEPGLDSLSREAERCVRDVSRCSEDLSIVEAYVTVHRLTELEEVLKSAQRSAERAEKELAKALRSRDIAVEVKSAASRLSGEILRESLASLRPLFVELCQRLRPHSSWDDIDFFLRGEVMPFLSFAVAGGLNPRFIFSSGQRRALGLAFLIGLHLSRSWCKLETLILDDPVQHIDDYRALHLVETLASLRMMGRQIICTVEDPALADLLCRRLRAVQGSEGFRIDLACHASEGVYISSIQSVSPFSAQMLAAD